MQRTMKDIAQKLGISVTTVSHAINGTRYVSAATKRKVWDTVNEMGYIPNSMARSLKNKSSKTIGIIIPNISSAFFPELVRACEDEAYENGYTTILCNTDEKQHKEYLYFDFLRSKQIDGILLASSGRNSEYISQLIENNIPIVFVDRYLSQINEDYIGFNNFFAAAEATQHLIDLGRRAIAFVTSKNMVSSAQERIQGYSDTLLCNNITFDERLVFYTDNNRNFDNLQRQLVKYLTGNPLPDAMLATNGIATLAAIAAFSELGLRCPEDIALIGFCDYIWSWLLHPHLTMVDLPIYEMGRMATQMLINKIESAEQCLEKRHIELETKLIVRDSCGARRGPTKSAFQHM